MHAEKKSKRHMTFSDVKKLKEIYERNLLSYLERNHPFFYRSPFLS